MCGSKSSMLTCLCNRLIF